MSFRISLLGLIGLVTLAGLACAALVQPSAAWLSVVVSLTAAAIVVQTLRALLFGGRRSAAASGWLLFAVAYLAITLGPWLGDHVGPQLLTSRAIEHARAKWPEQLSAAEGLTVSGGVNINNGVIDGVAVDYLLYSPSVPFQRPAVNYFRHSAHWLFAWLAGWLGAALAAHFHGRSKRGGTTPVPDLG